MIANPIYILGLPPQGLDQLDENGQRLIQTADIVYGSRFILRHVPGDAEKYAITAPLEQMATHLKTHYDQKRVVLATGDPNFFGIAEFLYRSLGAEQLVVIPHVSSIQRAFAKIKMSWHDAFFGSVHGRPLEPVIGWIVRYPKVVVLTDPDHHAGKIAQTLVAADLPWVSMYVCENLDRDNEHISVGTAEDFQNQRLGEYAVVILINNRAGFQPFGMEDDTFQHRPEQPGMITKKPVRAISIAQLGLHQHSILWDIGAGTGSVAIDSSRIVGVTGKVFAIEGNARDYQILCENIRSHQAAVTPIYGEAPEILDPLPDPDAVFVGGSGGRLTDIIETVSQRLKPGGVMVLNVVRFDHLSLISQLFPQGYSWNVRMVQTALLDDKMTIPRFLPDNPVFVVSAKKPVQPLPANSMANERSMQAE
ncbi:precorrin-6y C5,15-methyltransferase (decarboxylating) subunit CbiE [Sulfobacillus thermosulfidooxidans]|uniref:precorrin-6y C5,15-methyltransferase (decarboxylating) subunit CbiE n=1 Tax=Sulfobacillus thermosulfidooxidans TaxID=28034 RepID=UPI0006B45B0E|nr:precorrin-6y C5,15-methyltransferase (decarboxylating) subunit CbiE [Sulfobacillus thermosulfidooxidans]